MSRKKNGSKKLFDGMPVEPEHVHEDITESADVHEEREVETPDKNGVDSPVVPNADVKADDQPVAAQDDSSPDEILEDMRRSLIEEEAHDKEGQSKWWKRIGKSSRKKAAEPEPLKPIEEINLPNLDLVDSTEEATHEAEPEEDEPLDPIDELIGLLDKEETTSNNQLAVRDETPPAPEPEPEKVFDIEELKKQAFQSRPASVQEENLTEVRSIALGGDKEVFVEVQSTPHDPLEERISAVENAMKPYRRYINFGIAFLGLLMAVIAGMVLFNIYKQSVAASAPTQVPSNVPFPASVSLPGGWMFQLGKGTLVDGNWNPKGAEWLQGTEVCRWVALPWSRQLEAVVRTLNPDDPIELGMSNNDTLTYKVYSIKQMSPAEMQKLDSNTPCLLVVLAEPDAEKRWVLTALP